MPSIGNEREFKEARGVGNIVEGFGVKMGSKCEWQAEG